MYIKRFNENFDSFKPKFKTSIVDNFTVLIGKDSKSNDYLTFNMSDEDDLWFHIKGKPGAHLILKIKNELPTNDVIKKVAKLAVENGKASGTSNEVVYCKCKFVKKRKGMNDGQVEVDYNNANVVTVYTN